eukprot:4728442-Pyramimonas_sp.AAC.1
MSSETVPMNGRASCSPQTISARRHLAATLPLAGPTGWRVPCPAQPDASLVLGGRWISTWSPTSKRPSPISAAR